LILEEEVEGASLNVIGGQFQFTIAADAREMSCPFISLQFNKVVATSLFEIPVNSSTLNSRVNFASNSRDVSRDQASLRLL